MRLASSVRKALLVAAGLVLALALAVLGALAWLQSDGMRARVLARVRPALESRLGEVRIADELHLGWDATLTLGPVELPASRPDLPPTVRIERIKVRPKLRSLLSGRIELARVALSGIRIEAGEHGQELRARLEHIQSLQSLRRERASAPAQSNGSVQLPPVQLSELRLAVDWGRRIELGPFEATLNGLELNASLPGGGTALLTIDRSTGADPAGRLVVHGVSAEMLLSLADLPFRSDGGLIDADIRADASSATFTTQLRGLTVTSAQLAPEPVGPFVAAADGTVRWNGREKRLQLDSVRLAMGENREAQISLNGEVHLRSEPSFEVQAELEPLTFAQAIAALPKALVPEPALLDLGGRFSAQFTVSGPLRDHQRWELRPRVSLGEVRREVRPSSLAQFNGPFKYRPLTAEGRGREISIGPENPNYVRYSDLPHALVRAVLLSEDSMFFSHTGFDFQALKDNLLAPKTEGSVVRGGSTLTQQLAKNLFLSREKTWARKVKEALLTLALEASVPKERLLEIYFNVVEWGPGLYGIGEATRHYFDKDPRDLTVSEAVFLAVIIPNPVKYHVYCTRGAITEAWKQRMTDLLVKMHWAGDLTVDQLAEAEESTLVFAHR